MADSNMTKKALASALKELMKTVPFSKISVGDICNMCEMNRKSFYYHFKDKYDLINWIYTSEFVVGLQNKIYDSEWNILEDLCDYFYENRDFYRKALQIEGQNSFYDYFRDVLKTVFTEYIKDVFENCENSEFYVTFYSDAFVASIVRWISDKDCMKPQEYTVLLRSCLMDFAKAIMNRVNGQNGQ